MENNISETISRLSQILARSLKESGPGADSISPGSIEKQLEKDDELIKYFKKIGLGSDWKEKYLSIKESFNSYKDEEEEKEGLLKQIVSNLIILSKTEDNDDINSSLNKIKAIIGNELVLDDMNDALSILRGIIFSDDPGSERKESEEQTGGDEISESAQSFEIEIAKDIFSTIISKLKLILSGKLKERVKLIEKEVLKTKDKERYKELSDELSSILAEYGQALADERKYVEKFLKELIANLIDTEQNLIETLGSQTNIFKSNAEFSDAISNKVKEISTSFDISKTIEEVKKKVFAKIQNISKKITEKKNIDSENEKAFNKKLSSMQNKLKKIKREASDMKKISSIMKKEAVIDPLTKALNRRGYEPRMHEELERLKRYSSPCSLIMFDLDDFKMLNDKYGHAIGDKALMKIGAVIKSSIRKIDILGRYGGEEFVIILPNCDLEIAKKTAEKIRSSVMDLKFMYQNERVYITLSGGITQFKEDDTIEGIYTRADKCLYKAKNEGKNCIKY